MQDVLYNKIHLEIWILRSILQGPKQSDFIRIVYIYICIIRVVIWCMKILWQTSTLVKCKSLKVIMDVGWASRKGNFPTFGVIVSCLLVMAP